MAVGGQRHAPAALLLGKRPGTHFIGGWVSPREGPDGAENLSPTGIRSPDHPARSEIIIILIIIINIGLLFILSAIELCLFLAHNSMY